MGVKKKESKKSLKERMDALGMVIEVPLDLDYMSTLLKNKPPQYLARFSAWARNTLDKDEYMQNLVQACISKFATESLIGDMKHSEEFARGQMSGALVVLEEMERLSNTNPVVSSKNNKENS